MSLDDAFFDGPSEIGALKLRPFTIGSMTACRKMGLSIFTGNDKEPSGDEVQRQIVAFAWLQSEPLQKVLAALRNGAWEVAVDEFEWRVRPQDLKALEAEITRISNQIGVAAVDVVQRDTPPDPNEPGNF